MPTILGLPLQSGTPVGDEYVAAEMPDGLTIRVTTQQIADLGGGGGGGAVASVNGQTGIVVLDAADVAAVPTTVGASPSGAEGDEIVVVLKGSVYVYLTTQQIANLAAAGANPVVAIPIACGDETTAITTGTAKVTFRMPFAFHLNEVRSSLTTAPTGATWVVDINESGASILSTKLSIDIGEKTSTTAATPPVISDANLADDAEMTIDFDQVGSTIAGAGPKIYLIGYRL